jgi:hypothetical protein
MAAYPQPFYSITSDGCEQKGWFHTIQIVGDAFTYRKFSFGIIYGYGRSWND